MANNTTPFLPAPAIAPATSLLGNTIDGSINMNLVPNISLSRNDFPNDFAFGVGSSAFQVEGAADEGGKGKSIWDTFCEKKAAITDDERWLAVKKGSDQYNQYETDARLLKEIGVNFYRFSLSWARIVPNGRVGKANEGINKEGVAYYNNLINALKARGIEPFVTLFHWDLPQALDDRYGGFLSERIREDFKNYADFCFNEFGYRVKHWSTLNEPYIFSWGGYALGIHAPGHGYPPTKTENNAQMLAHRNAIGVSNKYFHLIESSIKKLSWYVKEDVTGDTSKYGSAATEPYKVGHNLLLAHADVYDLYKTKYKPSQGGQCGITHCSHWFEALDVNSTADKAAAQRELDFMLGWMMKPLITGDYPEIMRDYVKDRLPSFTDDDAKLLKNSYDFIGMNYYTAHQVKNAPDLVNDPPHFVTDPRAKLYPLGTKSTSSWIYVYEQGIQKLLWELKKYDKQMQIYVTENGIDIRGDDQNLSLVDYLADDSRIKYHHDHLYYILQAIRNDYVKVKGYFTWSFLDSFEFQSSNLRFGHCYVDYDNGFKRIPKLSAGWYKFVIQKNGLLHRATTAEVTETDVEVNQAGSKRKRIGSSEVVGYIEQVDPKRQFNSALPNITSK